MAIESIVCPTLAGGMKIYLYILLLLCSVAGYAKPFQASYRYMFAEMYDSSDDRLIHEEYGWRFSFKDGKYELSYTIAYNDRSCMPSSSENISMGIFLKNYDTLILHDLHLGYNMKVVVTDTTLRVLEGFEAMKDVVFLNKYGSKYASLLHNRRLLLDQPEVMAHHTWYLSKFFSAGDSVLYKFMPGKYYNDIIKSKEGRFSVMFTDEEYRFYVGEQLLTTGKWYRKDNFIMLKDETLQVRFMFSITDDNKIKPEAFPYKYYWVPMSREG